MKLIHLSDLHLGKRVNEFSMLEDQAFILKQILEIADREKPDGVLLAGDLYDLRVDTRVMFSAGLAAQQLEWLPGCRSVYAIPVSASTKNPFFDRKPKEEKKE